MGGNIRQVKRFVVHPSLILWISVLFYLEPGVVLPFLLAAAFHELGHYLALSLLNVRIGRIQLSFTGAAMETGVLGYREELISAAAGPIFSMMLGLFLPVFPAIGCYSLILGLFNLLPIYGLDGFRMMSACLHMALSENTANRVGAAVSLTATSLFLVASTVAAVQYELGIWPLVLGVLLLLKTWKISTLQ